MDLLVPERRDRILALLKARGRVKVEEIVDELDVSFTTARRDLRQMHQQGMVLRTRGGAVLTRPVGYDRPISQDRELNIEEKDVVGRAATLLVDPDDTLMMDGGTTTSRVLRHMPDIGIVVVTNCTEVVMEAGNKANIEILLLGGAYLRRHSCTYGPITERQLQSLRGDKAILGAAAISVGDGLTDPNALTSQVKALMSERCGQTIVVADYSKLGAAMLFAALPITQVDKLLTDRKADPAIVREFRAAGLEVIIAEDLLAQHEQQPGPQTKR